MMYMYKRLKNPLRYFQCVDTFAAQTEDGWEMHFQYNFLSHYLLTVFLLPQMLRHNEDARILLSSDVGHTGGVLDMKNMQGVGKNDYDPKKFWANSQLYMVNIKCNIYLFTSSFCTHGGNIFF